MKIIVFLKGILLGLSMVLPGVSGGTIAFVIGVYKKLIDEISQFNFNSVIYLFTFNRKKISEGIKKLPQNHDWSFLLPLSFGLLFSVSCFVFFIPPLLDEYFLEFQSLIFGIVFVSLYSPFKMMKKNSITLFLLVLSFFLHFSIFYFMEDFSLIQKDPQFYLFLPVGFLVAATLIIPGISGSYLLVLLGFYRETLDVLRGLEILPVIFFFIGILAGLFTTVRFIKIVLKKYFHESVAIIIGLILGSFYGLWPFSGVSFKKVFLFETDQSFFLFYMVAPLLIVLSYFFLSRFLKKILLK